MYEAQGETGTMFNTKCMNTMGTRNPYTPTNTWINGPKIRPVCLDDERCQSVRNAMSRSPCPTEWPKCHHHRGAVPAQLQATSHSQRRRRPRRLVAAALSVTAAVGSTAPPASGWAHSPGGVTDQSLNMLKFDVF